MNATAMDCALPSAVEAEQQLIGSLILAPPLIPKVCRQLAPRDFTCPEHRAAFIVLTAMAREGLPIDVATVKAKLDTRSEFDATLTAAYLADVGSKCVTAAHAAYHAAEVAEASLKRRLHLAAVDLAADAVNGKAGAEILSDLGAVFEDFRRERDGGERFKPITAKELAEGDYRVNWIIDWLLVEGQPCIVAGGKKCLKTTLVCDLLLSIATGGLFLGKFQVARALRVMMFSAESGVGTLQETCRRIAHAKGWDLADIPNFQLVADVPRLDSESDLAAFAAIIEGVEVVALDPAYLMMPGGDAGNLFIQGEMLLKLTRLCQRLNITLLIVHHTRKHRSAELTAFDPPELEDIAWAGFQEFARQWLLVGRRERYETGTGEHRLWLNYGGSAGQGGLWALDCSEGVTDGGDGRHWGVSLAKPADVRDEANQRRAEAKVEAEAQKLTSERAAVCSVLAKHCNGTSWSKALREAGISGRRWNAVKAAMIEEGDVTECEVMIGNHKTPQPGVMLAHSEAA